MGGLGFYGCLFGRLGGNQFPLLAQALHIVPNLYRGAVVLPHINNIQYLPSLYVLNLLVGGSYLYQLPLLAFTIHILPHLGPGAGLCAAINGIQHLAAGLVYQLYRLAAFFLQPKLIVLAGGGGLHYHRAVLCAGGLQGFSCPAVYNHNSVKLLLSHLSTSFRLCGPGPEKGRALRRGVYIFCDQPSPRGSLLANEIRRGGTAFFRST